MNIKCERCNDYQRDCICESCGECGRLVGSDQIDPESGICDECFELVAI